MQSMSIGERTIIGKFAVVKRGYRHILICALLAVAGCGHGSVLPDPVSNGPTYDPKEDTHPTPADKDVTLMNAFEEGFDAASSDHFTAVRRATGGDFRYYPAFPSFTESGSTVLMLRLDPSVSAGPENGAVMLGNGHTTFGSYSVRVRMPDIVSVQPRAGACVEFSLEDSDEAFGDDAIAVYLRIADQKHIYVRQYHKDAQLTVDDDAAIGPTLASFNCATKFYIYGIDWSPEKLSWWYKTSPNAAKKVLAETSENVPQQPLRPVFRFYHSKVHPASGNTSATQAPNYPYEMEVDYITYAPAE